MFKTMFRAYKPKLLKLLHDYCVENKEQLDVFTTVEADRVTVKVTMERDLFTCERSYNEIIETLGKIGIVE